MTTTLERELDTMGLEQFENVIAAYIFIFPELYLTKDSTLIKS